MKYKKLTKEQILITIDRLTRFKSPQNRYIRVYSDIITSCLIEPKLKKSDIEASDYTNITKIATKILNDSIISFLQVNSDDIINNDSKHINNIISQCEYNIYYIDNETEKLLNNDILYSSVVDLFPEEIPINLKWLRYVSKYRKNSLKDLRAEYSLKYPLEKVILAEGITEEILLPAFSRYLGHDFYKDGIQIIAAGGKNQVVKTYYKLINDIKLPIYILLDKDAEDNIKQIKPKLRDIDRIHLVSCGEFEDLLSKSLIVKTVNKRFGNFFTITESDIPQNISTAHRLEEIFKTKGLYEFKKADFAKLVRENINEDSDISDEIKRIIDELHA